MVLFIDISDIYKTLEYSLKYTLSLQNSLKGEIFV